VQRHRARKEVRLADNTKEILMESEIVELGTASVETREPIFPPYFFDGVNFQFFQPFWL
jgi:hypothetical protein